jgi:microcin C transport system ATP-binding protein
MFERLGLRDRAGDHWQWLCHNDRVLVRVARALLRGPRLFVADDILTDLDLRGRYAVMDLLSDLAREKGLAALITSGTLDGIHLADQVAWLTDKSLTGPGDLGGCQPAAERASGLRLVSAPDPQREPNDDRPA